MTKKIDQPWLQAQPVQEILALLNGDDEEARINGGAVRNALMNLPVNDVDISTTLVPRDVILRSRQSGHKVVPTGIEHGTVTVIINGMAFEVTTLREDVETDGRHARVLYGRDWEADARRRDLTMNALYLDADGTLFDPLGGMEDVTNRRVRFIDDAETRIREDYLRILRFFRFFAWYGAFRPDAEGLKACARLKDGLRDLSVERIWQELSKLLAAPDPARAVLWMRQTGVLSAVLPETEKWGIDALPDLVAVGQAEGWEPDALLRLVAILPPNKDRINGLAGRLKLPNKVRDRLLQWAETEEIPIDISKDDFAKKLYRCGQSGLMDRLRLSIAKKSGGDDKKTATRFRKLLQQAQSWKKPALPVRGQDLLNLGVKPGPKVAEMIQEMEDAWLESGFKLSKVDLLKSLKS